MNIKLAFIMGLLTTAMLLPIVAQAEIKCACKGTGVLTLCLVPGETVNYSLGASGISYSVYQGGGGSISYILHQCLCVIEEEVAGCVYSSVSMSSPNPTYDMEWDDGCLFKSGTGEVPSHCSLVGHSGCTPGTTSGNTSNSQTQFP